MKCGSPLCFFQRYLYVYIVDSTYILSLILVWLSRSSLSLSEKTINQSINQSINL